MCYSDRVRQRLQDLTRHCGAAVDWDTLKRLFRERIDDGSAEMAPGPEGRLAAADFMCNECVTSLTRTISLLRIESPLRQLRAKRSQAARVHGAGI
jgi:hypothetical protein